MSCGKKKGCANRVSNLPDFEGLAIFAKVVQTRSFVGAAEELRREASRCCRYPHEFPSGHTSRGRLCVAGAAMRAASRGATIQHSGWGGADVGFLPFRTRHGA